MAEPRHAKNYKLNIRQVIAHWKGIKQGIKSCYKIQSEKLMVYPPEGAKNLSYQVSLIEACDTSLERY